MGGGGNSQTQTQQMPPELQQYYRNINGIYGDVGSGSLTPFIPSNLPMMYPMQPGATMASNFFNSYPSSPYAQMGMGSMMQNVMNLGNGIVPNNPLMGQSVNAGLGGYLQNLLGGGMGPGGLGPGTPLLGGGSWEGSSISSSDGGRGYNPQTQADIETLIQQTNDDLTQAFERGQLADIRRGAIESGGTGGSRQAIAEGIAQEELGNAILRSSADIRTAENNNERNRLAQLAAQEMASRASMAGSSSAAMASMYGARLGSQTDAARIASTMMGQGYGYGLDALYRSASLMPQTLQTPLNMWGPAYSSGMDISDRNLQTYLNNAGIRANDLQLYANLMQGGGAQNFGTTISQGPGRNRFAGAVGGAASTAGLLGTLGGMGALGVGGAAALMSNPVGWGILAVGALAGAFM